MDVVLFLLGRGAFSVSKSAGALFRRQLPLTGPRQNELITRRACVLTEILYTGVVVYPSPLALTTKKLLQWIKTQVLAEKHLQTFRQI